MEVIITALVEGALLVGKGLVGGASKDLYDKLKGQVQKLFAGNKKAELTLEEFEDDPKTYKAPLVKKLSEQNPQENLLDEMLKSANELLASLGDKRLGIYRQQLLNSCQYLKNDWTSRTYI